MEAISLLLEVSQAQENDDYVVDYAARMGAKPLVSPNNTADIEGLPFILSMFHIKLKRINANKFIFISGGCHFES